MDRCAMLGSIALAARMIASYDLQCKCVYDVYHNNISQQQTEVRAKAVIWTSTADADSNSSHLQNRYYNNNDNDNISLPLARMIYVKSSEHHTRLEVPHHRISETTNMELYLTLVCTFYN